MVGTSLVDEVEWGQLYDPLPAAGAVMRRTRARVVLDTLVGPYPVPEYGWEIVDEATGAGHMTNPPALSIGPAWAIAGGLLYVLFPLESRVVVVSATDGAVRERWNLPTSARPTRSEARRTFVTAVVNRFGGDRDRVEAGTQFADSVPAYAGLVVDDQRRMWVSDHDPAAFLGEHVGRTWTVIDPKRQVAWSVVFPRGFRLLRVVGGLAYGIARDENGVETVHVYPSAAPGAR